MSAVRIDVGGILHRTASTMTLKIESVASCTSVHPSQHYSCSRCGVVSGSHGKEDMMDPFSSSRGIQVGIMRKYIHSCIDGQLELLLRQCLHYT